MNKGLIINEDIWPMVDELEPEEKADLISALSAYYQGAEIPKISRIASIIFKRIAADNARFDPENRKAISEIRSEAGQKGAKARWENVANDSKEWQTVATDSKNGNLPQDKIREDKEKIRGDIDKTENRPDKEEIREDKRERELKLPKEIPLPPGLDQDFVQEAFRDFREHRRKLRKPMTTKAEEMIIADLDKLAKGDAVAAVKILEQSIKNGWQGVFPLKEDKPQRGTAERMAAL